MTDALQNEDSVETRGLGSFTFRHHPPYSGRNPRTGEPVLVAAKRLLLFKVGKDLKELIQPALFCMGFLHPDKPVALLSNQKKLEYPGRV